MTNELLNVFLQIPSCVFWKNLNLEFMGGNNNFVKVAGLQSPSEIKGKTDYDFPWAEMQAKEYRKWDRKVLSGLTITKMAETQLQASGQIVNVIVNKSPLYNANGKIIGLICNYIENNNALALSLSKKQAECLRYVAEGSTAKQIAVKMSLSVRTVESYIEILKKKFSCRNKSQLISKIWSYHFLQGV